MYERMPCVVAFIISIPCFGPSVARSQQVYWIDEQLGVRSANLDGTQVDQVLPPWSFVTGFANDETTNRVYWTDMDDTIRRAHLDGSDPETVVEFNPQLVITLRKIALDVNNNRMYFTSSVLNAGVWTATLEGADVERIVMPVWPNVVVGDIALTDGNIYWTTTDAQTQGNNGTIWRSNLDGSDVEPVLGGITALLSIAIDKAAGQVYWVRSSPFLDLAMIQRANLDGSGVETIVDEDAGRPVGVALDAKRSLLYWSEAGTPEVAAGIMRSSLDGSGVERIITSPDNVYDIALDLRTPSDCDGDGSVSEADWLFHVDCLTGADSGFQPGCSCADSDRDGDVDLVDWGGLQALFTR